MSRLFKWVITLGVVYCLMIVGLLLARKSMIYPFDQTDAWTGDLPDVQIREVEREDGSKLIAWAAEPAAGKPVVFYLMGNIGHLEYFDPKFRELLEAGLMARPRRRR